MVALINLFRSRAAGNAVILHAGEPAIGWRGQVGLDVIKIEVEADVAVKIAVTRIAGITFVFAPDLARGIVVSPESGDAIWRENRRKRAITRPWIGVEAT